MQLAIKNCSDTAGCVLAQLNPPWPEMGSGFVACWIPSDGSGD